MRLRGVHEKRMTQVHGSSFSGRQNLLALSAVLEPLCGQFPQRETALAHGRKPPRNTEMRPHSNPRGRLTLADIGKEKQHQQRPTLGRHIDSPIQIFVIRRTFGRKAAVYVPARIARIVNRRKSHRKGPDTRARPPVSRTHQLIERLMQYRLIHRLPKWLLIVVTQTNYRLGPGSPISLLAAQIAPKNRAALFGQLTRKGAFDLHEPVLNKTPNFIRTQHASRSPPARNTTSVAAPKRFDPAVRNLPRAAQS